MSHACRTLGLGLALVTLTIGSSASYAQLATSDPSHYRHGLNNVPGAVPKSSLRDFRGPKYQSRVVLRRRADLSGLGNPHPNLSRACRDGRFRQVTDRRFVAVLDDRTYGAAIAGSGALFDPRGQGQIGQVYVFVGQGTTNCRVYQGGPPNAG